MNCLKQVLVHDSKEYPVMEEVGFVVGPGQQALTSVAVEEV